MKVLIVGGSISGLLHGVMLKHRGHDVQILERSTQSLEHRGAGIVIADEISAFLELHDRVKIPFTVKSNGARVLDKQSVAKKTIESPSQICSWDALYYRLRANYDNLVSKYCRHPALNLPSDGNVSYEMGKEFTGVESRGPHQMVTATYKDLSTGQTGIKVEADLVIGADGPSSKMRSLVAPGAPIRQYAGYVAWRGVVSESLLSPETRRSLSNWFTFHAATGQYVVVYHIPGEYGSLREGERDFNFVWYSWQSQEDLKEILTDTEGTIHRWSIPTGKLRPEIWEREKSRGLEIFSHECAELLRVAKLPFVQAISDFDAPSSPGPSFSGGRIILVGDAQCLLRPHTAFVINQAARHCLELEMRINQLEGAMGNNPQLEDLKAIEAWNKTILEFGQLERLKSISRGMLYMKKGLGFLPYLIRWKFAAFMIRYGDMWRALILGKD